MVLKLALDSFENPTHIGEEMELCQRTIRQLLLVVLVCGQGIAGDDAIPLASGRVNGFDVLIQAYKARGKSVIATGEFQLEVSITEEPPTEAEIRQQIAEISEVLQQQIDTIENPDYQQRYRDALQNIEETVREQLTANASRRLRVSYLIDGASLAGRRRMEFSVFDNIKQDWKPQHSVIRESAGSSNSLGLQFDSGSRTAVIASGDVSLEIAEPHTLGRLQGLVLTIFAQSITERDQNGIMRVSQAKAEALKRDMAISAQDPRSLKSYEIVDERPFETGSVLVIENEINHHGEAITTYRAWIDPSRGYICPLIQELTVTGTPSREWRSEQYVLDEHSGLWYPLISSFQSRDEDGELLRSVAYEFEAGGVRLNHSLGRSNFRIDLPPGTSMIDSLNENTNYKVVTEVSLGLEDLKSLAELDALAVTQISTLGAFVKVMPQPSGRLILIIALNLLAMLFLGTIIARRRWKSSKVNDS